MTKQIEMPNCISGYEAQDRDCNGYAKAKEAEDRVPCAFRDRCVAMIVLVNKKREKDPEFKRTGLVKIRKGKDGDKVAMPKSPKLEGLLDKTIVTYGIRDGRMANPTGKKKIAKKTVAAKPQRSTANGDEAKKLASWFSDRLVDATGRKIHPVPGDAEPGEFFLIDRMEKSNYAAVYAKPSSGKGRIAVASVYPNKRSGALQVRIAADYKEFFKMLSKTNKTRLEPADCTGSDGSFRVRLLGLDQEGAAIAAEVVGQAIEEGLIEIPEVGE